ncbi:hypothetical protein SAMN04488025_10963 [Planifilum fulgidum]|uniref:Uncharacterized protein n=1 Tax=Planifilum fulgidum TaxID=201973 RepID=A0A1I2MQA6_9BACL|nr:hypothetical protein SAMN04488025_10963 [Planifilum fulgidum]
MTKGREASFLPSVHPGIAFRAVSGGFTMRRGFRLRGRLGRLFSSLLGEGSRTDGECIILPGNRPFLTLLSGDENPLEFPCQAGSDTEMRIFFAFFGFLRRPLAGDGAAPSAAGSGTLRPGIPGGCPRTGPWAKRNILRHGFPCKSRLKFSGCLRRGICGGGWEKGRR